jgi:hypothetical protein
LLCQQIAVRANHEDSETGLPRRELASDGFRVTERTGPPNDNGITHEPIASKVRDSPSRNRRFQVKSDLWRSADRRWPWREVRTRMKSNIVSDEHILGILRHLPCPRCSSSMIRSYIPAPQRDGDDETGARRERLRARTNRTADLIGFRSRGKFPIKFLRRRCVATQAA